MTDAIWVTSALTFGAISYAYLKMPGGNVLRSKIDSEMTLPRRFLRRFLPFAGLALPCIIVRNQLTLSNPYKK